MGHKTMRQKRSHQSQNSTNSKISLWPVVMFTSQTILFTTPFGRQESKDRKKKERKEGILILMFPEKNNC